MNFVKGMMLGGAACMGAMIMYNEMSNKTKKRLVKKGKVFMRKMGII